MNKGKLFKYISNISFGLGAALAAVAFYFIFSARANLPAGVCPVNNNLPFIIPALVLLLIAFVTSFFAEKKAKRNRPSGKAE